MRRIESQRAKSEVLRRVGKEFVDRATDLASRPDELKAQVKMLRRGSEFDKLSLLYGALGDARLYKKYWAKARKHHAEDSVLQKAVLEKDQFGWMENDKDPRVKTWVNSQNAVTRAFLDKIPALNDFKKSFTEFANLDTEGAFDPRECKSSPTGYRYFQYKRKGGQDFGVLYYSDSPTSPQKVAIDPNTLSQDGKLAVVDTYIADGARLIAYTVSEGGSDRQRIRVRNIETGTDLPDEIPPIRYPRVTWLKDGSGFFYTRWPDPNVPEDKGAYSVYFHKLGTDPKGDSGVFGKGLGPENVTWLNISRDGTRLLISARRADDRVEIYYKDLKSGAGPAPFIMDLKSAERLYPISIEEDGTVYAHTTADAKNGRIVSFNIAAPDKSNWKTVVPETNSAISEAVLTGGHIVVVRMKNAHSMMELYNLDGRPEHEIKLPQLGSVGAIGAERHGSEIFFSFSSFTTPAESYRYDFNTGKLELVARLKTSFNPDSVDVKQVWYKSKDGTDVPMFLVHKKGIKMDGGNPTLLYGYGGFNHGLTPGFRMSLPKFIEDGGVYAVANIRGGNEFGEGWHQAGMRENKQNVFDDFIAAAEWLIKSGYTSSSKLAINGGSNGGLLVAAVMVQRPELFSAVVCEVPLTDMLKFPYFGGGKQWMAEYGNPDNPKDREYIAKYSPYHNVVEGQKYPPILIMSAENDTRTDPMHARKMAAMLQERAAPGSVVLLRMETDAGHGFATPVSKAIEEGADKWAFIYHFLDVYGSRKITLRGGTAVK